MFQKFLRVKMRAALLLFLLFAGAGSLRAQITTAGDIAFTGYNASVYGNSFSFILLKNIPGGTSINFTDIGWDPIMSSLHSISSDGIFTWTSSTVMTQFTEVTIVIASSGTSITSISAVNNGTAVSSPGTATSPTGGIGTGTGMILSTGGDQILAFIGTQSSPTFIAGIQCNSQTVAVPPSGVSTLAGWDDIQTGGIPYGANVSHIPPGLTNGVNAVMIVDASFVEYDVAKYNCTGANTSSSVAALAAAINDKANWSMSNGPGVTLPSGCSFAVTAPPAITGQPSNASTCAGGSTTFSVTATGATSYQWQVNSGSGFADITSANAGSTYTGYNSATLNIAGAIAAMNGYQYQVKVTGSSTITSNPATLTVTSPGTWLGTTNSNWDVAANWSCATVPTSSTNVNIPSGTPNAPAISSTTAVANNITIASGASLTLATSATLTIYGTLTNTGTYTGNATGSKTVFAGGAQTIPALTYGALQMNGAGSKTLAGAVTVNGTLTLTNGYILLGANNLTIASTGNITGSNINSFVVVNGTGGLVQNNIGSGGRTGNIFFPVGISTSAYNPLVINNNTGVADNFKVRVINHVYSSYDASDNPTSSALTTKVVDRTWLVTEGTAGGSNATVTAYWYTADEIGGFDNANCVLSHYYSGAWHNGAAPTASPSVSDPYFISVSGVTSFSPFGVGSAGGPLPLRLLSFSGSRAGGEVTLDWATADEKGVQGYTIERSADGTAFLLLSTVAANNSAAGTNTYRFTDKNAGETARLYYRLKMLDLDGSFTYSNTLAIAGSSNSTTAHYTVYPNPAPSDALFIRITTAPAGDLSIAVRDMTGRKLYQTTVAQSQAGKGLIPLSIKLPAGIYMMELSDDHTTEQIRMVRQ